MNKYVFKKGDTLRVIDASPSSSKLTNGDIVISMSNIDTDDGYVTVDVEKDGNKSNYQGFYAKRFELVQSAACFKVGDKVRVIDASGCGYIDKDEVRTVTKVSIGGKSVSVDDVAGGHMYEVRRFVLVEAKPTLKLPLSIRRSTGTDAVIMAGTEPGKITMIYVETGNTYPNQYDEAEVLYNLDNEIWTARGNSTHEVLTNAVNQAKITLEAAKAGVEAAEAALATAEVNLANNKPYLA